MSEKRQAQRVIGYPVCGLWDCDDEYDWESIGPEDDEPERYRAIKREEQIVLYHQPRDDWPRRLQEERNKLNNGDPLWFGKH